VKKEQKHYHWDRSVVQEPALRFENLVAGHLLKWVHHEQDVRVYLVEPGLFLESQIVLISGATGAVVATYRLPRQTQYGLGRRGAPLFMYLRMIDALMPDPVATVSYTF
jgi:hypothetical protein